MVVLLAAATTTATVVVVPPAVTAVAVSSGKERGSCSSIQRKGEGEGAVAGVATPGRVGVRLVRVVNLI